VLLIVAVVVGGYFVLLGPEDRPSPAAPPRAAPVRAAAKFSEVHGTVEVQRGAEAWQTAALGTPIDTGTSVRTGADGAASVVYGNDEVHVRLQGDSRMRVTSIDSGLVELQIGEGAVSADVTGGTRLLRFVAEEGDARVETRDGLVHVLSQGKGALQAAVSRGTATVQAGGQTVALQAGQATHVSSGTAPSPAYAIPASVFLHVEWPVEGATAKRRQRIAGTAAPRARVRVGREVVTADAAGRFQAVVELAEGHNEIVVRATDVMGRTSEITSPAVILDTRAPAHAVETDPNMWQRLNAAGKTTP
jgi:hypothetical protein